MARTLRAAGGPAQEVAGTALGLVEMASTPETGATGSARLLTGQNVGRPLLRFWVQRLFLFIALVALLFIAACSVSPVDRRLGAECAANDDCDERCLMPSVIAPDGFCTVMCDGASACPGASECIAGQGGVCLFSCIDAVDCAFLGPGWQCREVAGRPDGRVAVCVGGR